MENNETSLRSSLLTYKNQLSQVESALIAAGENADLSKLQSDLKELIALTEQSLLSFMKSKLLSQLEDSSSTADNSGTQATSSACSSGSNSATTNNKHKGGLYDSSSSVSSSDDEDNSSQSSKAEASHDLHQIIGTKCRAIFSHAWGDLTYHNAMIVAVEPITDSEEPQVRVMFTQPTHRSLVPCQFYLDNRCSYGDQCRFSHGHNVDVKDLKEYIEPDHESLVLESRCLAKQSDRVWYPGTVVEVLPSHQLQVMFDKDHSVETVNIADAVPLVKNSEEEKSNGASNDVTSDADSLHDSDVDDDDALPVYLWRPGQCNDKMADWEKHTKGIGSRIMQKQGYIMGQGLGIHQEGRAEPVPIQLLPQGKSLDKIMELKERAGNRDLYDVMSKQRRHQKKVDDKAKAAYHKEKVNVFDFINHKLGDKKGAVNSLVKSGSSSTQQQGNSKAKETKHITQKDLKSKSEKNLNIQLFQTAEEIRNTKKEISNIKSSIARNKGEPVVVKKLQEKLAAREKYLQQLQSSESSIESHKNMRRDKKKLAIF